MNHERIFQMSEALGASNGILRVYRGAKLRWAARFESSAISVEETDHDLATCLEVIESRIEAAVQEKLNFHADKVEAFTEALGVK